MNRPVGAAGKRLADNCLHPGGTSRADDDLAAMLFPKPQRFFERVAVGLVHLIADVLFADPRLGVIETWLPLSRRHLLNADRNLHSRDNSGRAEPRRHGDTESYFFKRVAP